MSRFQALEILFEPGRDANQFVIVSRCLDNGIRRHGGEIEQDYRGVGCHVFVLGFPDRKCMNAFFAHANWRELSHDLDAAGIRWRRADRAFASAA